MRYPAAKIEQAKTLITKGVPFRAIAKQTGLGLPALAYYSRTLKGKRSPKKTKKTSDTATVFTKKITKAIKTLQTLLQ